MQVAQEARQLNTAFAGPKEIPIPQWRLCMSCAVPMEEQNDAFFEAVKNNDDKAVRHLAAQ